MMWLSLYAFDTPGVRLSANASVRLDWNNEPQPDTLLRIDPGGRSQLDEDGYLIGAPELVVEVAASSASRDLNEKLAVYERHGVQEYLVWRTVDQCIDWFERVEGTYQPLPVDDHGVVHSHVFPGLALAVDALLANDLARVRATLEEAMAAASR